MWHKEQQEECKAKMQDGYLQSAILFMQSPTGISFGHIIIPTKYCFCGLRILWFLSLFETFIFVLTRGSGNCARAGIWVGFSFVGLIGQWNTYFWSADCISFTIKLDLVKTWSRTSCRKCVFFSFFFWSHAGRFMSLVRCDWYL